MKGEGREKEAWWLRCSNGGREVSRWGAIINKSNKKDLEVGAELWETSEGHVARVLENLLQR